MVYLSKIYTRSGDDGTTGLGDGTRIPKNHVRIESYGTADELGAVIGLAASYNNDVAMADSLRRIQNDLFDLGADLCVPLAEVKDDTSQDQDSQVGSSSESPGEAESKPSPLRVKDSQVRRLEAEIDAMNANLEPLKSFVLSGGNAVGAHLHHARCVARRCERATIALADVENINAAVVRYLNRLSDWLFVAARFANKTDDSEVLWKPGEQQNEA